MQYNYFENTESEQDNLPFFYSITNNNNDNSQKPNPIPYLPSNQFFEDFEQNYLHFEGHSNIQGQENILDIMRIIDSNHNINDNNSNNNNNNNNNRIQMCFNEINDINSCNGLIQSDNMLSYFISQPYIPSLNNYQLVYQDCYPIQPDLNNCALPLQNNSFEEIPTYLKQNDSPYYNINGKIEQQQQLSPELKGQLQSQLSQQQQILPQFEPTHVQQFQQSNQQTHLIIHHINSPKINIHQRDEKNEENSLGHDDEEAKLQNQIREKSETIEKNSYHSSQSINDHNSSQRSYSCSGDDSNNNNDKSKSSYDKTSIISNHPPQQPSKNKVQSAQKEKRRNVPLQEKILHMKLLNNYPLVKISHLYYHQLLKLARLQRRCGVKKNKMNISEELNKSFQANQLPKNTATKAQLQLCIHAILNPAQVEDKINEQYYSKRSKDDSWQQISQTIGQFFEQLNDESQKLKEQKKLILSLQIIGAYLLGCYQLIQIAMERSNLVLMKNYHFLDQILSDKEIYASFNSAITQIQTNVKNNPYSIKEGMYQCFIRVCEESNQNIKEFVDSLLFQL